MRKRKRLLWDCLIRLYIVILFLLILILIIVLINYFTINKICVCEDCMESILEDFLHAFLLNTCNIGI